MLLKKFRIKAFILFFIFFMLIILSIYYFFSRIIEHDKELFNIIYHDIYGNHEVDFQNIDNFHWDTLLIMSPYSNPKQVFEENGFKWQRISTNINISDHISLLVFLYDNEVVSYVEYPRHYGDFTCITDSLEQNYYIVDKEDAKFIILNDDKGRICIK